MEKIRIYVAGKMTGEPELNFPAFHAAAAMLRARGMEVVNPAEINGGADELAAHAKMNDAQRHLHWVKCMRRDIAELVNCDGIYMLPGFEKSKGASLEFHIASQLGLAIDYAPGAFPRPAKEVSEDVEAMANKLALVAKSNGLVLTILQKPCTNLPGEYNTLVSVLTKQAAA